jgi:hypothetical protein
MTMADAGDPQQPRGQIDASPRPGVIKRLLGFDSWIHSAASLSIVTLLAGWLGTYIQYLNAYEQKVGETAQADMKAASEAFIEISNAYAEAQMLQQQVYFNYSATANDAGDAGNKAMVAKAAQDAYPDYLKARNGLRKNSSIYVRKAELYIDWPSNLGRDAADTAANDGDPLTESLIGNYNFDCDAKEGFPHYEAPATGASQPDKNTDDLCLPPNETQGQIKVGSKTVICAVDDKRKVDHARPSREINWDSAKHHLIVMHYCYELTHSQISTARIWASKNEVSEQKKADFLKNTDIYRSGLDNEVVRLDAFLSLVMSQLERIRVKYRPSSFYCTMAVINYLISDRCTPVRIARNRG